MTSDTLRVPRDLLASLKNAATRDYHTNRGAEAVERAEDLLDSGESPLHQGHNNVVEEYEELSEGETEKDKRLYLVFTKGCGPRGAEYVRSTSAEAAMAEPSLR